MRRGFTDRLSIGVEFEVWLEERRTLEWAAERDATVAVFRYGSGSAERAEPPFRLLQCASQPRPVSFQNISQEAKTAPTPVRTLSKGLWIRYCQIKDCIYEYSVPRGPLCTSLCTKKDRCSRWTTKLSIPDNIVSIRQAVKDLQFSVRLDSAWDCRCTEIFNDCESTEDEDGDVRSLSC